MKKSDTSFDIDLSKFSITKEELEQERLEQYEIFKNTMLEFDEELSEEKIKELFKVKFPHS